MTLGTTSVGHEADHDHLLIASNASLASPGKYALKGQPSCSSCKEGAICHGGTLTCTSTDDDAIRSGAVCATEPNHIIKYYSSAQ